MTLPLVEPSTPPLSTAPRELSDDVLQSAEEAVLTDPVSVERVGLLDDPFNVGPDRNEVRPRRQTLGQYVAARPGQAALVAALLGAVAAGAVRHVLMRKRAGT